MNSKTRITLIPTLFSILLTSCLKNDIGYRDQEEKSNELRFFNYHGNKNSNITQISNDLKKLNQEKPFISKFIKLAGYPRWDKGFFLPKAERSLRLQSGTTVSNSTYIIPVVSVNDRFVTGAIIATIGDSSTYRLALLKDYQSYQNDKDRFLKAMMILDAKVYGYNKFNIHDTSAFKNTKQVFFSPKEANSTLGRITARSNNDPCDIIEIWYNPDGDACNCNGDEYYTGEWFYADEENCLGAPAPVLTFLSSGGGGYIWPPDYYPLPALGGGSGGINSSGNPPYDPVPTTEQQKTDYLIEQLNLNLNEQFYLTIHDGSLNTIFNYVYTKNITERRNIAKWVINFIPNNQDIPFSTIDNWFFKQSEYTGGESVIDPDQITYDQVVQLAALPSLSIFQTHFPKVNNSGNFIQMLSPDVYALVGSTLYTNHLSGNPNYQNACAIRGSRALLYAGITIPILRYNGSQRTEKGSDNKNYILDAVSFNKFMIDKFGDAPHKLTGTDANNQQKIADLLKGKNGIYVIVNNDGTANGAGYSGHVDLILNGSCLGGSYTTPTGGVKSIRVWVLN